MRDTSLVFPLRKDGSVLLGRKRRGMGLGKWNGFGGKIEQGETMRDCACRELQEECGLLACPDDLKAVGYLYFHQPSDPTWSHGGVIYFLHQWEGIISPSDEMEPAWFSVENLPYNDMWEADRIWLPMMLSGHQIHGVVYFGEDGNHVIDYFFEAVDKL